MILVPSHTCVSFDCTCHGQVPHRHLYDRAPEQVEPSPIELVWPERRAA